MRILTTVGVAVDDVLFLTTKGTEITKFSDVFIFVPFVLSVVKNSRRMIESLAFKIGFWRYLTTDFTTSTDKRETWDLVLFQRIGLMRAHPCDLTKD